MGLRKTYMEVDGVTTKDPFRLAFYRLLDEFHVNPSVSNHIRIEVAAIKVSSGYFRMHQIPMSGLA